MRSAQIPEAETGSEGRIQAREHPNHYILLVDASGSVVENSRKVMAFHRALDQIVDRLFTRGFEGALPDYVQDEDLLSLHHFGVVPFAASTVSEAYRSLREYPLPESLIHPQLVREREVSRDELEALIKPVTYYRLTIFLWAKALAFDASRPASDEHRKAERTFLIMVHDAKPNDGTLLGELTLVDTWGHASVDRVRERISTIENAYALGDPTGKAAWRSTVGGEIFIEVHEVASRRQAAWLEQLPAIEPIEHLELEWTREEGDAPAGRLGVAWAADFLTQLSDTDGVTGQVAAQGSRSTGTAPWRPAPRLEMPLRHAGPLGCEPEPLTATLRLALTQSDELLGVRTLDYVAQRSLLTPLPWRCGVPYLLVRGLQILLVLWVAAIMVYVGYFRFVSTHFTVKVPGLMLPLRLRWGETLEHGTSYNPHPSTRFLRLHLPGRLRQALLYRGVVVKLASDELDGLQWDGAEGNRPIRLPVRARRLSVLRGRGPRAPQWVALEVVRGRRSARLKVGRFPAAEDSQGGKKDG